jgi:hypothetical protein
MDSAIYLAPRQQSSHLDYGPHFAPGKHLIRPSATFSPSNAEKENPMGEEEVRAFLRFNLARQRTCKSLLQVKQRFVIL